MSFREWMYVFIMCNWMALAATIILAVVINFE